MAKKPVQGEAAPEVNLTTMLLPEIGPGIEKLGPLIVWGVGEPLFISTVSPLLVQNFVNVSVIGALVVDSSLHSWNIIINIHS